VGQSPSTPPLLSNPHLPALADTMRQTQVMVVSLTVVGAICFFVFMLNCMDGLDVTDIIGDTWRVSKNSSSWALDKGKTKRGTGGNFTGESRGEEDKMELVRLHPSAGVGRGGNLTGRVGSNIKERKGKNWEEGCSHATNHSILRPPFRIIQIGKPRSGSTFQHSLLDAIAHLKSPIGTRILKDVHTLTPQPKTVSYVIKTHAVHPRVRKLHAAGLVHVFSSGGRAPFGHYNQERSHLINCSMCEIKHYRTLFGLSCEDEKLLKQHMSLYEKLRRCCGTQMSKYRRLMLHGCDIGKYVDHPDYPHCETHNLTDVELQFFSSPISKSPIDRPDLQWSKPGDCSKFDAIIKSGKDFNLRPFRGCKDAIRHNTTYY